MYKWCVFAGSSSLDTAPVTGSLHFAASGCHLTDSLAAGLNLCVCRGIRLLAVCRTLRILLQLSLDSVMVTGGDTPADARSGINFDVVLEVPWNAPEAYVQLDSDGVYDLDTVPDVLGLRGRHPEAAVVRVLLGRDSRSVRALVPDSRVLDRGFHDATIVDMEDTMELAVSDADLSMLRLQWPTTILQSLTWMQPKLDRLRIESKRHYQNSRAAACSYCGKWIKCDMHRHVSTFHLELGQLWRCPVSWCTVWKGTPQDCMDHVRGAHAVSPEVKTACLGQFFPPWTVRREIRTDALKPCHSGISTNVLLFSEMSLALVHHYRVFRKGLPHISFRRDYHPVTGFCITGFCHESGWPIFSSSGQLGLSAEHLPTRCGGRVSSQDTTYTMSGALDSSSGCFSWRAITGGGSRSGSGSRCL